MVRAVLVLVCVALVVLTLLGMRAGWRNRLRRQQALLPPLPDAPAELGELRLGPLRGVYVGSAFAASWQDRVVCGGLGVPANAQASLYRAGIVVERDGATDVFIPAAAVVGARLAPGLAGTVVGAGGLLVVQWRHGGELIDSGLRADDKTEYPSWLRTLGTLAAAPPVKGAAHD
jgi:hypothetical protein